MKIDLNMQDSLVLRITIDERLADDLVRVLAAKLKGNVTAFNDDPEYWEEEEELLVQPDNYQKEMGMTQDNAKTWPWDKLQEGQVFLLGRFQINRSRKAPTMFRVDPRRRYFRRIDHLIKNLVKKKYLTALERSVLYGETNQTQ